MFFIEMVVTAYFWNSLADPNEEIRKRGVGEPIHQTIKDCQDELDRLAKEEVGMIVARHKIREFRFFASKFEFAVRGKCHEFKGS